MQKPQAIPSLGARPAQWSCDSYELSSMINLAVPLLSPPHLCSSDSPSPFSLPSTRFCAGHSPLRSLLRSLQAPVPRSFCQSLRPSSTTWYKFHSPFRLVPVWSVSVKCLGQSLVVLQMCCAFGRDVESCFLRDQHRLNSNRLNSNLMASSQCPRR